MSAPNVGTIRHTYGKGARMHKAVCSTCEPTWYGKGVPDRGDAFQEAVLHALTVHHWSPLNETSSSSASDSDNADLVRHEGVQRSGGNRETPDTTDQYIDDVAAATGHNHDDVRAALDSAANAAAYYRGHCDNSRSNTCDGGGGGATCPSCGRAAARGTARFTPE